MNRFRRLNPDDYGGMQPLLLHLHNKRREGTEIPDGLAFLGRNDTVSSRLATVGKPLQRQGEVREIQVAVEELVTGLLKKIGRLESCFISTMIPCGSFYEETKVTAPNEFDFMAEIQVLSFRGACSLLWSSAFPGEPIVKIHPFLATYLFSFNDHELVRKAPSDCEFTLRASEFRESFKETLLLALYMMDVPLCWKTVGVAEEAKGPAIVLVLTWNGLEYDDLTITVDITPAIKFHHWPEWTDFSALTASGSSLETCSVANLPCKRIYTYEICRYNTARYYPPSGPPVNYALSEGESPYLHFFPLPLPLELKKLGFHVVPVSPLWRTSFSVPELFILRNFRPDDNRFTCFRCAKYFRDQHSGDDTVLTSYILKTTFLFELEKFPEDKSWSNFEMFARIYGMMFRLLRESKEDMVCSYFMSSCYIANKQMETILPHAVQRVLDTLLKLVPPELNAYHCYHALVSHSCDDDDTSDDSLESDDMRMVRMMLKLRQQDQH